MAEAAVIGVPDKIKGEVAKAFVVADPAWTEAYQAVEYRNPDTYSINGYAAAEVLLAAAQKAGALDANRIASALRGLRLDTLIGAVQYDANGDRVDAPIYIYQVKGGAFAEVK